MSALRTRLTPARQGDVYQRLAGAGATAWALGLILVILTWSVTFVPPFAGLDPSWWAGLYMGAHRGMHFGTQIIFTYGPLGFLAQPWLWYGNLAVLAFAFQVLLRVLLTLSVVWALRRRVGLVVAVLGAFLVLVTAPSLDLPVVLAAIWCLAALAEEPPGFAVPVVAVGGALLGGIETLIELRPGPVVLIMCAVALVGARGGARWLWVFVVAALGTLFGLWFAAGQSLAALPHFLSASLQIVAGYSQAMGVQTSSRAYIAGAVAVSLVLIAAAVLCADRGRATRIAAGLVMAIAAFSLFKEAAVRADIVHVAIFYGSAAFMVVAVAVAGRLPRTLLIAALVAFCALNVHIDHQAGLSVRASPISRARTAVDQVKLAFEPDHRGLEAFYFAVLMAQQYRVPRPALALLRGHTVDVDPWEDAAAWAYGLNWDPLPVLQDYSAYTASLDKRDADALNSANGPERILRENPATVDKQYRTATIDGRFPGWDPPAKTLAMVCHYAAVQTGPRWQVLARVPDRCGPAKSLGSHTIGEGQPLAVPRPARGTIVFAKVTGLDVSGIDAVRSLLYRANLRYATVNATTRFRVVPGTAGDGLILAAAPGVDFAGPFAVSPHASTISFRGGSGSLQVALYAMTVRRGR